MPARGTSIARDRLLLGVDKDEVSDWGELITYWMDHISPGDTLLIIPRLCNLFGCTLHEDEISEIILQYLVQEHGIDFIPDPALRMPPTFANHVMPTSSSRCGRAKEPLMMFCVYCGQDLMLIEPEGAYFVCTWGQCDCNWDCCSAALPVGEQHLNHRAYLGLETGNIILGWA